MIDLDSYRELSRAAKGRLAKKVCGALGSMFSFVTLGPEKYALPVLWHRELEVSFKLIPGGHFKMGLSEAEEIHLYQVNDTPPVTVDEMRPVHSVSIPTFVVSQTPILKSHVRVISVEEQDESAEEHCPARTEYGQATEIAASANMRLPSEEEWEYLCRSTTRSLFTWGNTLFSDRALARWLGTDCRELSKLNHNAFGLYVLFAGEWCADKWRSSYEGGARQFEGSQVVRGGGSFFWPWHDTAESVWCMSAMRLPSTDLPDGKAAFRLVTAVPEA